MCHAKYSDVRCLRTYKFELDDVSAPVSFVFVTEICKLILPFKLCKINIQEYRYIGRCDLGMASLVVGKSLAKLVPTHGSGHEFLITRCAVEKEAIQKRRQVGRYRCQMFHFSTLPTDNFSPIFLAKVHFCKSSNLQFIVTAESSIGRNLAPVFLW